MPRTVVIKCVFVSDYWNDCIDNTLFLCNLLEKHYVIFIISWQCSLGGNFLAGALRYLSWPALSRSWHLAASGMGLGVMSHQAGCWPHCITSTSVFLSKEAIWWPPWAEDSQILGTHSVLPSWWIKLACITTIYHWCIYSIVLQMNAGFPFPLSWLVIGAGNYTSVYNYSKYLASSLNWNSATDCNNKPTRRRWREKIAIEKNIRKVTRNSKILKNRYKNRYSDFLVVFPSSKA